MSVVIIPETKVGACDLLDGARDKLRTVHAALNPDGLSGLDDQTLSSV